MTYKELVNLVEHYSLESPGVNSFYYGDLENLNKQSNIPYPRIVLVPSPHEFVNQVLTNYVFTLVYVDRLTDNRYKLDIQSQAITTIKGIINRLNRWGLENDQVFDVGYSNLTVYTDPSRFVDQLTGAFATVIFEVNDNLGGCDYGDN